MPASLQTRTESPIEAGAKTRASRSGAFPWFKRTALIALALFVTVNSFLLWRYGDDKPSSNLWNGTGSIDIAVRSFQHLKQAPRVVLLGSSLMMYPFWTIDQQQYPLLTADIFHQRRSKALEDVLAKHGQPGQPRQIVYSFAIFGQMISDAYLYIDQFLKGDRTPEYVVFGLAPRDFHDNDLPAPMATYSFKKLVGVANFAQYANLYLPSFQDKADFLTGRICFFYGRRWNFQREVNKAIAKLYGWCGINCDTEPKRPDGAAGFMMWGREDVRWNSSLNEYKRRYNHIEGKDVELQMGFLRKVVALCQQRHIKLVLVNMPLTDVNRALMPPGFYQSYRHRVAQIADCHGVTLVDLGESPEFTHADFWDTTHLNHLGGYKLVNHILPLIDGVK